MDYASVYKKMFNRSDYNVHPRSEPRYSWALSKIHKGKNMSLLDVGAGRGNFLKLVATSANAVALDVGNFHNLPIRHIDCDIVNTQRLADVVEETKKDGVVYDYVTCLDVMEHIEEEKVDNVLMFLSSLGVDYLFAISNHSDVLDGVELHLTQRPLSWWKEKLEKFYNILSTKTECGERAMFFHCRTKYILENNNA